MPHIVLQKDWDDEVCSRIYTTVQLFDVNRAGNNRVLIHRHIALMSFFEVSLVDLLSMEELHQLVTTGNYETW